MTLCDMHKVFYSGKGIKKSHLSDFFILMAVHTGIEPVISSVTGRHVNRYTNAPLLLLFNSKTFYFFIQVQICSF